MNGVGYLKGITRVIDELGLMILAKEVELATKQAEIEELRKRVELLEGYLDVYDEYYSRAN